MKKGERKGEYSRVAKEVKEGLTGQKEEKGEKE